MRLTLRHLVSARKPALAFIFVTVLLDILGIGLIIPIVPRLIQSFQGGDLTAASRTYGLLVSLYSLMQFVFAPILGSLSDRFGRRPVILISLFGSALDYFFLSFAPSLPWFFLGRIISGITGANITAATAYIADVSPPEKRAANFGMIGAAFGLGFIAGPALGGLLGEHGLRVPLMVAGGLTLVNWFYGMFVLPESLAAENRRPFSWNRSHPIGALLDLRRHPVVLGLVGTYFLVNLAHNSLPATWVLYTHYRYNWTAVQTGLSLAIVGIMAAIVQGGLTRVIVGRLGEQKSAALGLTIGALAFIGYGLATRGWMIYVILVFSSLGGVTGPAIQGMISRSIGADEQGGVQGSLTSLSSVAGIIGPFIASNLFAWFISEHAPIKLPGAAFFFSSFVVLIALALALRSFGRQANCSQQAETQISSSARE